MQTYPGGIQSGMDYYLNDAGLLVAETTIAQTRFDITGAGAGLAHPQGHPVRRHDRRGRRRSSKNGNNGLYTNEWLLGDIKTNEIAMFELGTHKSKLWRSSKDEWFGGTKGFYWGCNNAKDLDVRLETVASVEGKPANVVFHPSDRDRTWLKLYDKHKGKIDAGFGFEAFTTPPLAAFRSLDAKFTTTAMAKDLKTWALFGPPLGKAWDPSPEELRRFPASQPLVSNDWTILTAAAPGLPSKPKAVASADGVRLASLETKDTTTPKAVDLPLFSDASYGPIDNLETLHPTAWHGTILPAADADIWLAAAFADYEPIVSRELALKARAKSKGRELSRAEKDEIELAMFAPYSHYRISVTRHGKDIPLTEIHPELTSEDWYGIAAGKGVLALASLRAKLGDDAFLKMMDAFGRAHAGKAASTLDFLHATGMSHGQFGVFISDWISRPGLPEPSTDAFGWSINGFETDLDRTVIVYGTLKESDAQREAATRLQRQIERKWSNIAVPIVSDKEASSGALKGKHLLLIGRPETNAIAKSLDPSIYPRGLSFDAASFTLRGDTFANPKTALIVVTPNPDDSRTSIVMFAGLSAEATWHSIEAIGTLDGVPSNVILMPAGGKPRRLAIGKP